MKQINYKLYALRYGVFFLATALQALGIVLVTRAYLGTTPINSFPFTLSHIFGLTLGMWTMIVNICFLIIQKILLGRHLKRAALLQIPAVFVFSVFIDIWMYMSSGWEIDNYILKWCLSMSGNVALGLAISVAIICQATVQPGEGIVLAISHRMHRQVGNIKVLFDCTLVSTSAILSFVALGHVVGLREGTLVSALTVGMFVRFFSRFTRHYVHYFQKPRAHHQKLAAAPGKN